MQGADIFLHKLARRAIAAPLRNPTAGLGWSIAFITSGFAQKTDAEPVGGRGISAFSVKVFLRRIFLIDPDVAGTRAEIDLPSQSIPFWGGKKKKRLSRAVFYASSVSSKLAKIEQSVLMQIVVIPMKRKKVALERIERDRNQPIQGNVVMPHTHSEHSDSP
ncbi:hypothetical protein PSYMO_22358 [Pseudomonas amygdali pv. mori str. 301020]|uniref:Uncharacterized protein n=1 Tax=Pseudomonas amygdali pv. mori str. 301020 TaxID=629261 RepID=A0A656GER5_PSEA0|nr:hypothetical protein PSYMO_22358 [Pseudomonas amygdali pv. mori str. 301020]